MEYFDVTQIFSKEQLKNKYIKGLAKDIKNQIPKNVGERIKQEFEDGGHSYQIGIARARKEVSEDIFKNGYKVFGDKDTSFGVSYYDTAFNELYHLLREYVTAPSYKMSNALYVFKIPKESILYYKEGTSKPILKPTREINEFSSKCYRILPEYILGYFPLYGDTKDLIENPNYRQTHNYSPEGLEFEESVINDRKRQEEQTVNYENTTNIENTPKKSAFRRIWENIRRRLKKNSNIALPEGQNTKIDSGEEDFRNRVLYEGEIEVKPEFLENNNANLRGNEGKYNEDGHEKVE